MVQLGELAQHWCRLVLVLGHGAGQSLGAGRADGLLVVGDVSDEQGAKVRDQLQVQRLPQPEQDNKPSSLTLRADRLTPHSQ